MDNALDACEDVGVAPEIAVTVNDGGITVTDNGPGIPAETVAAVLDFSRRVSSREHYVSPTRGAQGNALKSLVMMPFVLDGRFGCVEITARGVHHRIEVRVDRIRQEPVFDHQKHPVPGDVPGSKITIHWPDSSSILADSNLRFLQMAFAYGVLNPHLTLTTRCFGQTVKDEVTDRSWRKWLPSDPTSAHWYPPERFERLVCGYLAHDEDRGRQRTVRELIAEFDGLTGSAKQKAVLDATGLARQPLSALLDSQTGGKLLAAMKSATKPVKPQRLGTVGKDHLAERFKGLGCEMESFRYKRQVGTEDGLPYVVETAFAWNPNGKTREFVSGVNWSPGIRNQFRKLGLFGHSLDEELAGLRAGVAAPIVFMLHVACPRVTYADRGKSQILIQGTGGYDSGHVEVDS
jgi:DNA topoisomerase VI subunit B